MEYQIKKYTNEMLDSINGTSTNSLCFEIPLSYALVLVDINWSDILFGISNGYFNIASAKEYAVILLGEDNYEEKVLELACLDASKINKEALLQEYVIGLANEVSDDKKDEAKDKIMYVLLKGIFDIKEKFEDPLFVIEIVYDDFGFPKTMESFVRYMPNKNITLKQYYNSWNDYLCSQKLRFGRT